MSPSLLLHPFLTGHTKRFSATCQFRSVDVPAGWCHVHQNWSRALKAVQRMRQEDLGQPGIVNTQNSVLLFIVLISPVPVELILQICHA